MAFEKRIFQDGDTEYSLPRWRRIIEDLTRNDAGHDFIEELNQDKKIDEKDITLKNPLSDSYIDLKKNGDIDIFSENGTGIRFVGDRVEIHADKLSFITKNLETHTNPNGVSFNGEVMNKGGYNSFPRRKGKTESLKKMIRGEED
ncbi:hypothetical protein [Tetragenococcus halophilus]|uniref:hypothetical protein n=1 Tax=Tetragenococcus halophilus TaxID=51669 RepID=UPI0030100C4F